MKWFIGSVILLVVLIVGFFFLGNTDENEDTSELELMEMNGTIYYLSSEDRWVITTVEPNETITSDMTYDDVEKIVGFANVHFIDIRENSSYNIDDFKHGDKVSVWAEGIMESYPSRVAPVKMEHRK